uniref:Gon-4 like b n=1 Tax=Sparus aurata TaxID=8175 RepID=A0A671UFW3_SPAAU
MMGEKVVTMETSESSEDELGRLDIDLDRKSRQHNLSSSNVRAILHEVITHERVVAMMKAAIRDTQDLPMFEPKMTRSRLRQAVQQGQASPPQFVDIDLEEDEDSSDEEYCPDEEEEEEEEDTAEEVCSCPTHPPSPRTSAHPSLSTYLPTYLLLFQCLVRKAVDDDDDGGAEDSSCLAYRTRSKLRLVNVPMGQLEAELLAPDITADMYEQSASQRKGDRHWTTWLQGLMAPDVEEEADDDDDPEYNFLDDLDEPDLEDYRTDRAVQITSRFYVGLELSQDFFMSPPQFYTSIFFFFFFREGSHAFPVLPANTAWLFATRPIFLYPELLPVCSLEHSRHHRSVYTPGENGLIVLALKHFEGTLQTDQLISSYLLCKSRWSFRKHVREMSGPRAPNNNNIIKTFLTRRVVPTLPLACSSIQPGDQRPPVDRNTANRPNWLKNSQLIIQKTRLTSTSYPPSLPPGCTLRLHPHWLNKSHPPHPRHRRLFTLAHNASLPPLAKAPADGHTDRQVDRQADLSLSPPGVSSSVLTHPVCADIIQSCLPIGQRTLQSISMQQESSSLPALINPTTNRMLCTAAAVKPGYFLLQMMWTPPAPPTVPPAISSQHARGQYFHRPKGEGQDEPVSTRPHLPVKEERREEEKESSASPSTLSPLSSCAGEEEEGEVVVEEKEDWTFQGVVSLNGGENTAEEDEVGREGGCGDEESGGGVEGEEGGEGGEEGQREDGVGEGEEEGQRENGGGEGEEEGQREDGGGEGEEEGEKDKDEDQDRQGEEEEEEDFDDLTQDEDEEEVMSSASEESVLSVPELQETMKQLTWLAAERRLCADGDSEEDHSPTSPGSQEEEEEEEEEGTKGEESGEGRSSKEGRDEEMPTEGGTPRGGGRCPGRGRGQTWSRQERHSKDTDKLLLLYDEKLVDNDPHRESKDVAFAQSYLNRVREALQDTPGQVEDFVSLLNEFEQAGDGQEVILLFRKLRCILGDRTDLLRDFAAFLHPEQALQCGLFEEQQAFERSRRFLRQLEISFGDNPSHYQKIIKALQTGPDLSPTSIHELKAQMATLLKGHAHLQAEFWVFFEELRPPVARPGQFEEAHWPEDAGGGSDGGEEVTLPELEEEDEGHKIQPMTSRRQRRKMDEEKKNSEKEQSPSIKRSRREEALQPPITSSSSSSNLSNSAMISHTSVSTSTSVTYSVTSSPPLSSSVSTSSVSPITSYILTSTSVTSSVASSPFVSSFVSSCCIPSSTFTSTSVTSSSPSVSTTTINSSSTSPTIFSSPINSYCSSTSSPSICTSSNSAPPRPSPPPDLPVCAKNISLTASGEKVILWTREADRVILTTCQQEGANQNTFQAISTLLGNKTPSEVSRRFRDLMRLFRTAARQTSSEDEAPPTETPAANEEED